MKLKKLLLEDSQLQELILQVEKEPQQHEGFKVINGMFFFSKNKLYIPHSSPLNKVCLRNFILLSLGDTMTSKKHGGELKRTLPSS